MTEESDIPINHNDYCDMCSAKLEGVIRLCYFCETPLCETCASKLKCTGCGVYPCTDCSCFIDCYDKNEPHDKPSLDTVKIDYN